MPLHRLCRHRRGGPKRHRRATRTRPRPDRRRSQALGSGRRADRVRPGRRRRFRAEDRRAARSPAGRETRRALHAGAAFEQSFTVRCSPAEAFAAFGRIREIADCIPGAFVDGEPAPDRVEGGIRVKLGPIAPVFRGVALVERSHEKLEGRILGTGADARERSTVQGEIRYRIVSGEKPGTARVELAIGYAVKGALAQFARPVLVRNLAGRMIAEFSLNLEARLTGRSSEAPPSEINLPRLVLSFAQRAACEVGKRAARPAQVRRRRRLNAWRPLSSLGHDRARPTPEYARPAGIRRPQWPGRDLSGRRANRALRCFAYRRRRDGSRALRCSPSGARDARFSEWRSGRCRDASE